jgi:sarcosine oxidase
LIEAFEIGHPFASSSGDTRLWRLSHTDAPMVRLGIRAVDAWRQLERDTDTTILLPRGLLWRGSSAGDVAAALSAGGVAYTEVAAADVDKFFPGLRPNESDAVWQSTAGPLWAAESLRAHRQLFLNSGGTLRQHTTLLDVVDRGDGLDLVVRHGGRSESLAFDVVVFACGPRTSEFLPAFGLDIALEPVLEQVSYVDGVDGVDTAWLPGFYDGPTHDEPGLYAMPVPGVGYKLGLDLSIREYRVDDTDREPSAQRVAEIEERVARDFASLVPTVTRSTVCSWTDSPDGRFVIDTALGGRAVLACGDSGTGFKFSALMGHVLANLAEGNKPDADVAAFGVARLAQLPTDGSAKRFLQ